MLSLTSILAAAVLALSVNATDLDTLKLANGKEGDNKKDFAVAPEQCAQMIDEAFNNLTD